jgi:hypothetical protein
MCMCVRVVGVCECYVCVRELLCVCASVMCVCARECSGGLVMENKLPLYKV